MFIVCSGDPHCLPISIPITGIVHKVHPKEKEWYCIYNDKDVCIVREYMCICVVVVVVVA